MFPTLDCSCHSNNGGAIVDRSCRRHSLSGTSRTPYPVYKGAVGSGYGPTAVPAPAPIPEVVEWYFRGDFSGRFFDEPSASDGSSDFHQEKLPETWGGGGGVGYYFGEHLRGDLTLDYNTDSTFSDVHASTNSTHDVNVASFVGLANLYYDILPREHFTPYVGGGIGFAYHETENRQITLACPCPPNSTAPQVQMNSILSQASWLV